MADLYALFQNPDNQWRGKPFWSWNGKLEKDELFRQIQVLKEMGCGGFFMHSRTGLNTEYLGDEWFELINACTDEGERLGMEAWLYDEDRWPSGTAGGMVTKEPKFRQKFLYLRVKEWAAINWDDPLLVAVFAAKLDGVNCTDCIRIDRNTPAAGLAGKSLMVFGVEEINRSSFYNGYTYVDTMNREATEHYLQLTHEKYKARCGDRLGRSIKGIFTDEPHRGQLMDTFCVTNENPGWQAPWTFNIFEEFEKRFGYDLIPRLPELFLKLEGRVVSQVKWHYTELLQQLFLENFAKPCDEWCRKNNVILCGHILHEDTLASQTAVSGSVMRYYEWMEYPGVDVLAEGNRNYWIVKQLQSAARQLGRQWLLSELYGCTGWQMPFLGHKWVGDWQALFGINLRCHHLSWYTMEGESKRDFPASIFHHSAWWRDYPVVETYFSRINVMMAQGTPVCDVLVLNPVESIWCQIYAGWGTFLWSNDPKIQKWDFDYQKLFHWLTGAQIDFDYGDEEMLGRLYAVEKDADGTPVLRLGQVVYKTVVAGAMLTIRSSTLRVLDEFMAAGGKVIFTGEPPAYVDALASGASRDLAARATQTAFEKEALVGAVKNAAPMAVEILDGESKENLAEVFCQLRRDDKRLVLMCLNVNREKSFEQALVRVKGQGSVEEWNCLTGERFAIPAHQHNGYLEFKTDFVPAGERVYVIIKNANTTCLPLKPVMRISGSEILTGPYDYRLSEPNVCVLDFAGWRMNDGPWQAPQEVLKVDRAVRKAWDVPLRGGEMLQPWFVGQAPVEIKGRVELEYDFFIETMPRTALELVMERPDRFKIQLNDTKLDSIADQGWWVDKVFRRLPVPAAALRPGRNTIRIATDFHYGTNLEALFLMGGFGVRLEGTKRTLVRLPEKLAVGDAVGQGLPFYSGSIVYSLPLRQKLEKNEAAFLIVPAMEAACAAVNAAGRARQIIGWPPYEAEITDVLLSGQEAVLELETVLTRRNSFGPLHQVPKICPGYGPDNFITEGEGWSDDYQLFPAGLLAEPVVEIRAKK